VRRALPWLALVAVVIAAVVVLAVRSEPSDAPDARARRLERRLACPVCEGESLADSNVPEARAMRADIRDRIAGGQSDGRILDTYADAYGEDILLDPDNDGIGLVVWVVPVVGVAAGAVAIGLALRRWSRQPRLAATADDEVLVARARKERA
jgi:cytochrome c-type biogenesis protein CcmH